MSWIEVNLLTQLKAAAKCSRFEIECNAAMPVSRVLSITVERYKALGPLIFNDDGEAHGWLLIGVNEAMVARGNDPDVQPGSNVLLGTPISGG
jgi:hypothetical protein